MLGSGAVRGLLSSLRMTPSTLVAFTGLVEAPSVVAAVILDTGCWIQST
jgi:hypothetical protein